MDDDDDEIFEKGLHLKIHPILMVKHVMLGYNVSYIL